MDCGAQAGMNSFGDAARPRFTGVRLYNHARGLLSFWYPQNWHKEESAAPHIGVTLWPNPDDPLTHILIDVKDLQKPLAEGEAEILENGIREGLSELEDCTLEAWRALSADEASDWGVEWHCSFQLHDALCVRQARMFAEGKYLYAITFQGSSHAHFDFWKGMFEFVMLTVSAVHFSIPDWAVSEGMQVSDPYLQ